MAQGTGGEQRSVVLVEMLNQTNMFAMVTVSDEDPTSGGFNKACARTGAGSELERAAKRGEADGVVLAHLRRGSEGSPFGAW